MSELKGAQKRWNWINGWLAAGLHACIAGTGLRVDGEVSVEELLARYCRQMRAGMVGGAAGPPVEEWEIEYVFHLEEELWGVDWRDYVRFFPREGEEARPLQTFHFVLAFYLVERCLKLLAEQGERYKLSHRSLRRRMFGREQGLLTVKLPWALEAMGAPFFLYGSTSRVGVVGGGGDKWERLRRELVSDELKRFYRAVAGREQFTDVVERGLVSARRDHLVKCYKGRQGNRLPAGTRSWWYDVLWHYSESVRYHPLAPSERSVNQPFHWNRTIRWFASVLVTGLLLIAANRGTPVVDVWRRRSGRPLSRSLGGEDRFSGV